MSVHENDIKSFEIAVPEEHLLDLRRRLTKTRWPEPATVSDWSQGVPLGVLQELCRYWRTKYDWRATERRLNRSPQYLIEIDGLTIHYFHVSSSNPSAAPLILTQGWPGSFFELAGGGTVGRPIERFGLPPRRALAARLWVQRQALPFGLGRAPTSTDMG